MAKRTVRRRIEFPIAGIKAVFLKNKIKDDTPILLYLRLKNDQLISNVIFLNDQFVKGHHDKKGNFRPTKIIPIENIQTFSFK